MAAGLEPNERFKRISDAELEEEFRRVHLKLGKVPTRNEFTLESIHSPTSYEKRFGTWQKTIAHYLGQEAAGVSHPLRNRLEAPQSAKPNYEPSHFVQEVGASMAGRVFGPQLDFRGLRHEPVNEQGVVFLFGMVAHELGFLVEGVRTGYPDCSAKREIKGGYYVDVNIEFEFKSRNFDHDPTGCNLVICWEHDWPDCPVPVLKLKTAIRQLPPHD